MRVSKVYNRIESIIGNVITVRANGVQYKELAQINTRFGKSLAQVNKLEGDIVSLQVFAGGQGISTGDEVRFLGHEMRVSFSEDYFFNIHDIDFIVLLNNSKFSIVTLNRSKFFKRRTVVLRSHYSIFS